jgi:hypothetical protein
MNKKIFGLIFALVLIILPCKNVIAEVVLNPVIIKPTTVTLLANGSLTKSCYDFVLYDLKDSIAITHPQVQKVEACRKEADENFINPDDNYRVTFSNLTPGNEYKVEIKELGYFYSSTFMTAFNDSDLNNLILEANNTYDQAIEGINPGNYKVGSKAKLNIAINKAEYINGDINIYTQSAINNAARDLQTSLDTFELSKVVSTTGLPINSNSNNIYTPTSTNNDTQDIEKNGIVPRCNYGEIDAQTGQYKVPCNFTFFMKLVNNVIKFLLFVIATPLIALIIMYTAYLYLTAGGNSGQVEKVKHILFNAVIGYIIALAAWLIIKTILTSLNVDPTIETYLK